MKVEYMKQNFKVFTITMDLEKELNEFCEKNHITKWELMKSSIGISNDKMFVEYQDRCTKEIPIGILEFLKKQKAEKTKEKKND